MKVVLDTNVVISAIFFGGDPLKIVRAARSRRIELVATHAVLSEYREVAERLHEQYPTVAYRRPLAILESLLVIVSPSTLPKRRVCRDPDDDAIIACALGAKAKLICSGDDDLLSVNGYAGVEILRPHDFCTRYL